MDSNHEPPGSEPGASAVLGYEGVCVSEPQVGIEPTTVRLQGGRSAELSFKGMLPSDRRPGQLVRRPEGGGSWGNHGFPHAEPLAYKAAALPS